MSEVQDSAAQISRANRGYRSPQQVDDFLSAKSISIDYNLDGTIASIVQTKSVAGAGTKQKVSTFSYDSGKLVAIDQQIL